jgi:CRP-like cAMP-binding protein
MSEESALLRELGGDGVRRRFRKGEALFSEGDVSDRVLVLESGWVKISFSSPSGRETVLGLCGPGELLGELSTLDGSPRSAGAIALEEVEALVVPGRKLERALDENTDASLELLRIVAARLRDADRKQIEFTALDTLGRVASRLIELAERFGKPCDDGIEVHLPLSQEELAGWCGSSRESTVKALRTLRELECLSTGRGVVTIRDPAALRRHATPRAV